MKLSNEVGHHLSVDGGVGLANDAEEGPPDAPGPFARIVEANCVRGAPRSEHIFVVTTPAGDLR